MAKAPRLTGDSIGRNVTVALEGDMIVIRMSASAPTAESKSGKSAVLATTNGNVGIPGTDLKIGLNVYRSV
jgi:hypothetical protein